MQDSHYGGLDDDQLWAEYVDGSDGAFTEIRNRYQEPIWRYLLLSGQDQRGAAQALGQILCHMATHRRHMEGFSSVREWIFAIATQQVVPAHVPEEDGLMDFVAELKQGEPETRAERMRRAIGDMQRRIRQPFLLFTVFGLSIPEAARACRFPEEKTAQHIELAYRRMARSGLSREEQK